MKQISFLILFLSLFSSIGFAKSFECTDPEDGFNAITIFNSKTPFLNWKVIVLNPDGSVSSEHTNIYLSEFNACKVKLNFAKDCTSTEEEGTFGYQYSFECPSKKITGGFYVDEAGTSTFTCNNNRPVMSFNCQEK
jgi:hypothetical protein